jgi:glycosyltransferase involved in cell wall biosynthesis
MTVDLSLAMIVRDEEALIGSVLESAASVCEELVVIDTGSTDRTRTIAEARGAAVREIVWRDDFATARNASFAWCTCAWILWLDADDILPQGTKDVILGLKGWLRDNTDVVVGPYHYRIEVDGTVLLKTPRERLIRRESGLRWEGRVHEVIPLEDIRAIYVPELIIEHRPELDRRAHNADRNIRILQKEIDAGHPTPRTLFYYANELYDHARYLEAAKAYSDYIAEERRPSPDRYWAQVYIAESARFLGDENIVREASAKAIAEDPSRAEGYVSLGRLFFDREEWDKALPLFAAATSATPPTSGFVRNVDYLYGPWDFLSVCLDRLGRRHEALAASERALPGNPEADRIRSNMRWLVDNL